VNAMPPSKLVFDPSFQKPFDDPSAASSRGEV